MKRISSLIAVTALSAIWSAQAAAAWIEIDYQGFVGGSVQGSIQGVSNMNGVNAGWFDFDVEDDPSNVYWSNTLQAFCIDVEHLLKQSDAKFHFRNATEHLGAKQLSLIGQLYDRYAGDLGQQGAPYDAAFQLALWDIIYDYDGVLSLADGNFIAKNFGSAQTTAQAWLSGLSNINDYTSGYDFFVLAPKSPTNNQALLLARALPTQVPEPGTLALLGIALLGFAPRWIARRHRGPAA